MRWTCYAAGMALAALLSTTALAQEAAPAATAPAEPAAQPAPPEQQYQPLSEGVVAVVNDEIISTYDLRQRLLLLIATSGVKVNQQNLPGLQQQALRSLVDERLQMQELKRFDVKVGDPEVDEEIEGMAKQNNMSKDQLLGGLTNAGVDPSTIRNQLRAQIGWQMLVTGRYRDRARVGSDQVEKTLQRISTATTKPQYLVGEIFLDANTVGGMTEATNGAASLVDQIIKGAPFQAVARQFSNAPSGPSGGDAGWLMSGEIEPEIETVLQEMRPGQLSRPIPTKDGVWIVYLREQRAGGGASVVNLKQLAVRLDQAATPEQVDAAQKKLNGLRGKLTCSNFESAAKGVDGVVATDLGDNELTQLAPEFQTAAGAMKIGEVSAPVRTAVGMHVIALCGKHVAGQDVPTKEQVENRLFAQQISMLARRYLRDLRNSATIEMR
jgi:peptidyl-prolyl cis-trans isomerase SurA